MSTGNKPTVQQAAKQGNPQAIAILLNRQLQPKGTVLNQKGLVTG